MVDGLMFSRLEFLFLHEVLLKRRMDLKVWRGIKRKGGFDLCRAEKLFVKREFQAFSKLEQRRRAEVREKKRWGKDE